jgi:hypothetical protein
VAELSHDLDQLEAQCLYALWLNCADLATADNLVSAEEVGKKLDAAFKTVEALKKSPNRPNRIGKKLNQLCERGFATMTPIDTADGRAGRPQRGYKIAPSNKIVKTPATAAALHYLLNHRLLPIPQQDFMDEVLAQNLHDHKSDTPLSQTDLERHLEHCIGLGYIIRMIDDDRVLFNVGDRTRQEVHYLRYLSTHAQRKPPQQADDKAKTPDVNKTAT